MYNGIREYEFENDEDLAAFYEGRLKIDLEPNQYLLLVKGKDIIDKYKNQNGKIVKIKHKTFESQLLGKVKARNIKQELFLDLLDSDIPLKCVSGPAGSGKTYLATAYALQKIQEGKFDRFVVIKNNVTVADVPDIGAVPGDVSEKLKTSNMFIGDIVTPFMFESMLEKGDIELCYLGNMRGRSLNNVICLCSEAQNLTTTLVKMVISRMGEKSVLIMDFDLDQIDRHSFEKDNGMVNMVETLKDNPLFGMVELDLIERSELAKLAGLIK